jgi:hypothetical protein
MLVEVVEDERRRKDTEKEMKQGGKEEGRNRENEMKKRQHTYESQTSRSSVKSD